MKYNDITVIILLYHTPKKLIQNIKNYRVVAALKFALDLEEDDELPVWYLSMLEN